MPYESVFNTGANQAFDSSKLLWGFNPLGTNSLKFLNSVPKQSDNIFTGAINGFGNIFSSANDYLNKNSKAINNFGTIAGALGDAYSAYNTAKTAKDMYNLQKSRYALSDARQKRADDNLSNAWANSSYARG